jgi:hypothetical protein
MDIDNLLRAENLTAEAGDAVLAKLDDRQQPGFNKALGQRPDRRRLHVDHVRRTDIVANPATRTLCNLDMFDHPDSNILDAVALAS